MAKHSNLYNTLKWITDILGRLDIQYQVVGGLAAKCYGTNRPLHDIDFYVPGKAMPKLKKELEEYIELGPTHHKDDHWDIVFMKLNYNGQQIEFGDADRTKYFDSNSKEWVREKIDFGASVIREFEGIDLPMMPKEQLIKYKKGLNREVDQIDLKKIDS